MPKNRFLPLELTGNTFICEILIDSQLLASGTRGNLILLIKPMYSDNLQTAGTNHGCF